MCGIVGFIGSGHREFSATMNAAQIHRGPDEGGIFSDHSNDVSLAMRRLSIVDIEGGHQPMLDAANGLALVFNGEIFNAPALRAELEAEGRAFKTDHSDTEVILALYARDGHRCVQQLNGMFAFALLDRFRGTLLLARDPLGIKPLHYWKSGTAFAFASEVKSILALPFVAREVDGSSLSYYLSMQSTPPQHTIYSSIRKLGAGSIIQLQIGTRDVCETKYWTPPTATRHAALARSGLVAELRNVLESAVLDWTMGDVEMGVSLSGGVDSAAVVGLLSSNGFSLRTWTLGFEGDLGQPVDVDERDRARAVSRMWGTEHSEIVIQPRALIAELNEMVDQLDEPYAGGLPSWFVYKAMGKHVKVALTGTGGDELFGNYGKWRRLMPFTLGWATRQLRAIEAHGLHECLRSPNGSRLKVQFGERHKASLLLDPLPAAASVPALLERLWASSDSEDPRQAVAFVDLQTQLPEEFLMMTDRFSMRWSLEARTPLLDKRLVEFCLGLPPSLRSPRGDLKAILVDAVGELLPQAVIQGPKKGFVLPTAAWLRGELKPMVDHFLAPQFLARQGIFRSDLHRLIAVPHARGRDILTERLWTLLMFQLWWDRKIG